MADDGPHRQGERGRAQSMVTISLVLMATLFSVVVLTFLTQGVFLYVALGSVLIFGVGQMHYWLWGRALKHELAGEIEEERLRRRAEEDEWGPGDPRATRR